jgi:hypothetical protein
MDYDFAAQTIDCPHRLRSVNRAEPKIYTQAELDAAIAKARQETWAAAIECVPTNWLDTLLTGPDAVIDEPPYACPEIEVLLRAVITRMRNTEATTRAAEGNQE